ncbi:ankyrin repeats family protein [Orientia chuto str. Dubai]|uniref:Ankyrin repeats family protein n=1 Tax=Orientia chuto str. Dubai TaxID=1359168 RepID=A0A0F3MM56_9RICK|nr:ankyrin repeat domain-containing protein [Candidatus Orientia mediorientalis]KJV56741.1 ankyrin repeats family protein [Orientia chuto str. Dubai]
MNQEDLAQQVVELIKHRQYSPARRLLIENKDNEDIDMEYVDTKLSSELSTAQGEGFINFCKNIADYSRTHSYAFNGPYLINEGMYCLQQAATLFKQGKLDFNTAMSFFGGMDVSTAIALLTAPQENMRFGSSSMSHQELYECGTNVTSILMDCAMENLKYKCIGKEENEFISQKLDFCARCLNLLGMEARPELDQVLSRRIGCILEKSSNPQNLLTLDAYLTHTTMFRLIDHNCLASAKLLINSGASIHPPSGDVLTLLDAALKYNNYDLAKMLVQRGVDSLEGTDDKNLSSAMVSLLHTQQFFKDTGYFKENKSIPDQVLEDSIKISAFIKQDKSLRNSSWPILKAEVDSGTLMSQMAYEVRSDPSLHSYFIELTQLELSKLQLSSATGIDTNNETSTAHRDKYVSQKSKANAGRALQ